MAEDEDKVKEESAEENIEQNIEQNATESPEENVEQNVTESPEETNKDKSSEEDNVDAKTETKTETTSQKSPESKKHKNKPEKVKRNIEDIVGDESLPEIGGDYQDKSLNSKLKQLQLRRKVQSKNKKSKVTKIVIAIIFAIGLLAIFLTLKSSHKKTENYTVMELPTFNVNVMSKSENNFYNIKVNVAVGVRSKDVKNFDKVECFNIVHETISEMDYDDLNNEEGQQRIKENVHDAILEKTAGNLDCKVYIAGTDLGQSNISGRTINTNEDAQAEKADNISNKTNLK